jgi:hypothetical protein
MPAVIARRVFVYRWKTPHHSAGPGTPAEDGVASWNLLLSCHHCTMKAKHQQAKQQMDFIGNRYLRVAPR